MNHNPSEHAVILFMLRHLQGLGPKTSRQIIQELPDLNLLFEGKVSDLAQLPGLGPVHAERLFALGSKGKDYWINQLQAGLHSGVKALCFTDTDYPKHLRHRPEMPPLLFMRGKALPQNHRVLAIVGTRNATRYGLDFLERLMHGLRGLPVTVLSGMARGIDRKAHEAAIFHGLRSDAVVAHGPEQCQPPGNADVGQALIEHGGAFWSEHPAGTEPQRAYFAMRNRIIAAMADAVLLVESGAKGGAMITAKRAMEYKKPLFALPGLWYAEKSKGCHLLLKEGQASCVLEPDDIKQSMQWDKLNQARQSNIFDTLDEQEQLIARALQQKQQCHLDELAELLDLPVSSLSSLLTMMELKGMVQRMAGNHYQWNWMQ